MTICHSMRWTLAALALPLFGGCGAVVLTSKQQYAETVGQLQAEIDTAARAALASARQGDMDAFESNRDLILNACGKVDRLVAYGEAAVKSYYGQQNSLAAIAALEQQNYQRNCVVDGLNRLEQETLALRDTALVLQDACSCDMGTGDYASNYVPFSNCSMSDAAWDDFWDRNGEAIQDQANQYSEDRYGLPIVPTPAPPVAALPVPPVAAAIAPVIPVIIAADLLVTLISGADRKENYCKAVHRRYAAEFRTVATVSQYCSTPPAEAPAGAPYTAAELTASVERALAQARDGGIGQEIDGSSIYAAAYSAQSQCAELSASLERIPRSGDDGPHLADVDTQLDLEPGGVAGDYTPPEIPDPGYTPPRE